MMNAAGVAIAQLEVIADELAAQAHTVDEAIGTGKPLEDQERPDSEALKDWETRIRAVIEELST